MGLGEQLREAMEKLRRATFTDKTAIKEAVKQMQRALISADVDIKLVLEISKTIEKAAFASLPPGLNRREHVLKETHDALAELLGGKSNPPPENPKRILLVGLFGSGKTTTCGKIAKYYAKRGKKVGIIAGDTFRPAALEQLQQIGEKIDVPILGNKKEKNAQKIVKESLKQAKEFDLLVCDSAGRDALDTELQKEIKHMHNEFEPEHTWLVLGADMGQLASKQSKAFHELLGVNGVIITRLDGSAKGGGALAACHQTKSPVFFVGTGENPTDLQSFDATRYLSRIMGYGDLQSLLEKAQEASLESEIDLQALAKGQFTFETFYQQLEATKKMGPLDKVMDLMGLKQQLPKELMEVGQEKLDKFKFMMDSMSQKEKQNPELLNNSRISRIAKGSGTTQEEVRSMLKQFKHMQKAFKKLKKIDETDLQDGKGMEKLQKLFAKKKKFKIR
ncbi:signal recognition particle receptor subunit alpha [Candidatus Micrarchaeota archaeon]|nr:signal recognition particle receptor subunit alpha [Candidatus Micrarchaeota archaeon]